MFDTDNKIALESHDALSASSGMGSYHEDESCSEEWIRRSEVRVEVGLLPYRKLTGLQCL
jgi:hypothetical protein